MSQTEPDAPVPPKLAKVRIKVVRWANTVPEGDESIVDPAHLVDINRALDDCIWFMKSRSIPTLRDEERLVPETAVARERWLIDVTQEKADADGARYAYDWYLLLVLSQEAAFAEAARPLMEQWEILSNSWDGYLSAACGRLGDRFRATDCPAAGELWRHFIAWGEYEESDRIDSQTRLGQFSAFEKPASQSPPPVDVYDAVSLARELQRIRDEYEQGRMAADEYRDRSIQLMDLYPPGE